MVGWLVGLDGISTLVGYLMPNPVCIYIKYTILKEGFISKIFKQARSYLLVPS